MISAFELFLDGKYMYLRQVDRLQHFDPPILVICDNDAFIKENALGYNSTFKFILGDRGDVMGWDQQENISAR